MKLHLPSSGADTEWLKPLCEGRGLSNAPLFASMLANQSVRSDPVHGNAGMRVPVQLICEQGLEGGSCSRYEKAKTQFQWRPLICCGSALGTVSSKMDGAVVHTALAGPNGWRHDPVDM
jgi:hypothetical protein